MKKYELIIGGRLYEVGFFLALGMNIKLYGLSYKLLFSLLSWINVGYLIAK